ncbi:PPE domain-containing protein [Actinokineospora sp. G85]|uniref:PPE domain-containing protein n=1 Tax=Actinokineospora sp. G85 TaxID=3406626 RepID=UPI003C746818
MDAVERALLPVLEVQSALVGTDGPTARAAREQAAAERTASGGAVHEDLSRLGDRRAEAAGAGYDAPSITDLDEWRAWGLAELHAMVDGVSAEALDAEGERWQALGASLADGFGAFAREIAEAVDERWDGAAAAAATTTTAAFAEWGARLGAAVDGTGTRIRQAATAVEMTKLNLPRPQEFNWQRMLVVAGEGALVGGVAGAVAGAVVGGPAGAAAGAAIGAAAGAGAGGGGDVFKQFVEHQQAQERAAEVMDTYYSANYIDVDTTTPAFSDAAPLTSGVGGGSTAAASAAGVGVGSGGVALTGGGAGGIVPRSGVTGGGDTPLGHRGALGRPGGVPAPPTSGRVAGGSSARPGAGPFGAGGGAGARREEDQEHQTKFVQKQDSGLFSPGEPYARPVIGG